MYLREFFFSLNTFLFYYKIHDHYKKHFKYTKGH